MIVLRLPDGDLLVLLPDGRAIRIRPDGKAMPGTDHNVVNERCARELIACARVRRILEQTRGRRRRMPTRMLN